MIDVFGIYRTTQFYDFFEHYFQKIVKDRHSSIQVSLVMSQTSNRRRFKMSSEDDIMIARQLFSKGTLSVLPHVRLRQVLQFQDNVLQVEGGRKYTFPKQGCHVVGFGKAVIGMAAELQRIVGSDNISKLILSVPVDICDDLSASGQKIQLPKPQKGLTLIEGAKNNIPDKNALKASQLINETASHLKEGDLLIVLISGGGSALLPAPKPPLSLEEKARLTASLSKAGASIQELNAVRIQLSSLKGGKLAQKAYPAQVLAFILSDIIGDPLHLISSGPTILQKPETEFSALNLLKKYNIEASQNVLKAINDITDEKLESDDFVENILLANNEIALESVKDNAHVLGMNSTILTSSLAGEAKFVGGLFGALAFYCSRSNPNISKIKEILEDLKIPDIISEKVVSDLQNFEKTICLISGGETIVKVKGTGRGGRNQEMVLASMIKYHELESQETSTEKVKIRKNYRIEILTSQVDISLIRCCASNL